MLREMKFLLSLWKANLLSAMEYRVSFLMQCLGMMVNNAIYFGFWMIFFHNFENIGGWNLADVVLLYGTVACSLGLALFLFGNLPYLSEIISTGKLDYYLSLPRPVLLHVLASRSSSASFGDFLFGIICIAFTLGFSPLISLRFLFVIPAAAIIYLSFLVIVHSLSFWLGNAGQIARMVNEALITFSIYPTPLFNTAVRIFLLVILPAGFIGIIPVSVIRDFSWQNLFILLGADIVFLGGAILIFQSGLRLYESGSAIQNQV